MKTHAKKIIESNCNKALKVIEKLQKAIVTTIDRQIDPTIKEIKDKQPETYSNLDRSRDKFVSKLRNSVSKEIERFKTDLREEMYAYIDDDIENDKCKVMFKHELQKGMEKLGENIKKRFEKDKEQFRKDLQKDAEQFEDRIENFLERLKCINIIMILIMILILILVGVLKKRIMGIIGFNSKFDFRNIQLLEFCKLGIHRIRISWDRQISVEFF